MNQHNYEQLVETHLTPEQEERIAFFADRLAPFYALMGWEWFDPLKPNAHVLPDAERIAETMRRLACRASRSEGGWTSTGRLRAVYEEGRLWFAVELEIDEG
jgi:hypothetical protein